MRKVMIVPKEENMIQNFPRVEKNDSFQGIVQEINNCPIDKRSKNE